MAGLGTVLGDSISWLYSLVTLEESDTFFIFHSYTKYRDATTSLNGRVMAFCSRLISQELVFQNSRYGCGSTFVPPD
jgi:hypothetical protein